eukprot:SAG31_NODE_1719_length_7455_cov_7.529772_2_plen_74_part_00
MGTSGLTSTNQINRVVKTPEPSLMKIFETRIVDASGTSIEAASPRLKRALKQSGVDWNDLAPKPLHGFLSVRN